MVLNITYGGRSGDVAEPLDESATDADVRRVGLEVLRSGAIEGLHEPDAPPSTFDNFVVDRLDGAGGLRLAYLRPKVPFGTH